jgi:ribulose-bisphosphate carboxylase small chain
LSFLVQRPAEEPGFRLDRTEAQGRVQRYALHPYSTEAVPGSRYTRSDNGSS